MVNHTFFHPKIANFISQLLSFQQWNSAWAWAAKVRILHGETEGLNDSNHWIFWGFHMCFDHFKPTFVVFPCYFCQKSLGPSGHFLILESWTCPESRVPPLEETRPWYGGITGVFMGLSCLKTSDFLVYIPWGYESVEPQTPSNKSGPQLGKAKKLENFVSRVIQMLNSGVIIPWALVTTTEERPPDEPPAIGHL